MLTRDLFAVGNPLVRLVSPVSNSDMMWRMRLPGSRGRCRGTTRGSLRGRRVSCCRTPWWSAACDAFQSQAVGGRHLSPSSRSHTGRLLWQPSLHLRHRRLPARQWDDHQVWSHTRGSVAFTRQVVEAINSAVDRNYFLPGPRIPSINRTSARFGWYQIKLLGDRGTCVPTTCPGSLLEPEDTVARGNCNVSVCVATVDRLKSFLFVWWFLVRCIAWTILLASHGSSAAFSCCMSNSSSGVYEKAKIYSLPEPQEVFWTSTPLAQFPLLACLIVQHLSCAIRQTSEVDLYCWKNRNTILVLQSAVYWNLRFVFKGPNLSNPNGIIGCRSPSFPPGLWSKESDAEAVIGILSMPMSVTVWRHATAILTPY